MRLKNTCASSTAGAARAGSSEFLKIQPGTEREAREAELGGSDSCQSPHSPALPLAVLSSSP